MKYRERNTRKLGAFYTHHVNQMTEQELVDKGPIAAELAYRDKVIHDLIDCIRGFCTVACDGYMLLDVDKYDDLSRIANKYVADCVK